MTRMSFPFPSQRYSNSYGGQSGGLKVRLIIALVIALFAVLSYYARPGDENQITGKSERVALAEEADEVQMGLQAVPQMSQMHGGRHRNDAECAHVQRMGEQLLRALDQQLAMQGRRNPYRDDFRFTLLADPQTVNAFALPGGQVFITYALYRELETEGQLAGVLGHEIGHVIERHSNKRMAKEQMFQGLAAAGGIAGGDQNSARMAQMITSMISMKYGRADELESDKWGVRLTTIAGYDPRAMIGLMKVLERTSGGAGPPEFMSTHPKPANREAYIQSVINEEFPEALPPDLKP